MFENIKKYFQVQDDGRNEKQVVPRVVVRAWHGRRAN